MERPEGVGGYFLRSGRLGFRHWAETDLPLALGLWGDPAVTRLIGGPFSEAAVRGRLAREIATQRECGLQYWPLFLLEGGEHVGCAGLRPYRAAEGIYELGVHLREAYWGRGLAREASGAVIDYAFGRLGAAALFAGHHPGNQASRQLLCSLGFRHTHEELYPPTGLLHPSYLLTAAEHAASRSGAGPNR